MKTTLILLFVVASNLSYSQIKRDKVLHFGAGMLVGGITAFVSEQAGISDNKLETLIISTSVSTFVAVGKETYDKYVRKTAFSERDVVWTAIGGIVGDLSVTYTIKPRNKHIRPTF